MDRYAAEMRLEKLQAGPHFRTVAAANRAYLTVAVPHAPAGGGDRWVLTCLPATGGGRRLSAVSMSNMETFVLFEPDAPAEDVCGFVVLRRRPLEERFGLDVFTDRFELDVHASSYVAAGEDQMTLEGTAGSLVRALQDVHVAMSVGSLADDLMKRRTPYARFHSHPLTQAVLGV